MLIDSHCHLNYDYAPKGQDAIIREAHEAGVEILITVAAEMGVIPELEALSAKHANIYHTVGIHPHEAISMGANQDEVAQSLAILEKGAQNPKCRAIGEIGLDYHYDHSPREIQRLRLDDQLNLALKLNLPVIIHSREAEDDLLESLKKYAARVPADSIPGIIHCFSGTRSFGEECLKLGFYISFSGILTFKKADELRECAAAFPLERLLIETDSPYLAPLPHRGKKCEPSMVKLTALKLAEVKGVSFDEIARVTTANAKRVFRLSLDY